MHRIAASIPGSNFQTEGVIFLDQTPAPIVLLTAADTDIQTLAAAVAKFPPEFPPLRVANLLQLQQQLSIDTYAEAVLEAARAIVVRLLGGRSYWSYGLEVVRETAQRTGAALIVMPGDDRPDPDLISHSTVSLGAVNQLWRYFTEGGVENIAHALQFLADISLGHHYNPPPPRAVPRVGLYLWKQGDGAGERAGGGEGERGKGGEMPNYPLPLTNSQCPMPPAQFPLPKVGILFYRAHYLAGNVAPIDALCQALSDRHLQPVPVFVSSLRDAEVQAELLQYFQPPDGDAIDLLLNTTSFAISQPSLSPPRPPAPPLPYSPDVPVLQVIFSSSTVEMWESGFQGLSPRDMAMNVALPEVDGRVISRAVSFKTVQQRHPLLETEVVVYQPEMSRIAFVADLAKNWVQLRKTPPSERRIALILANYPTRDGRLANGVGLDTPASCVEILKALQAAGYRVGEIPASGDELIARLTAGVTNDPEGRDLRAVQQYLSAEEYWQYFGTLPQAVQQGIGDRWGLGDERETPCAMRDARFPIPGIQLGNVFVGIQPSRGYDADPSLNYHAPDLEPPHTYLAFYYWVRFGFGAGAIVHVGKHGNLEWLPGKSVALSECCYPEAVLGPLPHLYPFIVNDPGEGSQAKRRSHAVIIDHLTPPMTRAELYGPLLELESLIDEYYDAQSLDPKRLPTIRDRILELVVRENLHQDFRLNPEDLKSESAQLLDKRSIAGEDSSLVDSNPDRNASPLHPTPIASLDAYLCELKEAQIRDGLHIFGQCPQGRQLRDLMVAIARHPSSDRLGLTRALARDLGLDFDPLTDDFSLPAAELNLPDECPPLRTLGDITTYLEEKAAELVEQLITRETADSPISTSPNPGSPNPQSFTHRELEWMRRYLLPALQQTEEEIVQLLRGLDGRFVPSGAAGAPTRGRPDVLPTGRNFYSVDIRAIPTETAWRIGQLAAEATIERYTQENGEYPKTLGLSVWGTSTMRTGGDDIAVALALIGARPIWDGASRRVVDFEILPVSALGRPRVDVTLRISGFFRDAFSNLIDLFDRAVAAIASLDEPTEENPLAAQVNAETQFWQEAGLTDEQAIARSRYRIFGSKPGAYGAGLQGLIESQNWTDDEDLARAYINWSCYAYAADSSQMVRGGTRPYNQGEQGGISAPEAFEQRLKSMQIVLHNQDNREHDLLDSDDYYQFQGGLTVAVRATSGKTPQTYFGDNSIPEKPKVRRLQEEIARVYRSRVVNPKWIAGAMRHGYKGAFEMAATLDYLFAYDATARCVEDYMYEGVAKAYVFDAAVQEFVQQKNPWALRDMAERLLEARQRGLWQSADEEMVDKLRAIAHQAEGAIESTTGL